EITLSKVLEHTKKALLELIENDDLSAISSKYSLKA
ncbi:aminoacyl-tRNA hydrolase, partial [Campylobacter jejuni]